MKNARSVAGIQENMPPAGAGAAPSSDFFAAARFCEAKLFTKGMPPGNGAPIPLGYAL